MSTWKTISSAPLDQVVMTKIDDVDGCRNEQKLIQTQRDPGCRRIWWFPDMSMYVYYQPTHWRPVGEGA
ncbi:hypothetical protein ABB28_08925 [Stenotrophomonas chelatiphaga]|uniref:DUF551 domain-containing protein n=1 Tax=Stenotrophomonas chelatiphaga TaxID=517011 RepID=A0A0R0D6G6_9GAMM|nr:MULTISPECIES: hypothetical protein [Stenotrophomonas]KRG73831.1 hypothetical protein ABB28_08925 [Stenotrophomonas chelatiphaga]MBD8643703.1 hypothetical protein [Stenotrophomonas sp. CFBP 13724]